MPYSDHISRDTPVSSNKTVTCSSELKKRFCQSEIGKKLFAAFEKTNGYELTDEFKENAIKNGKDVQNRQTGQYVGGKRNIILLDKEKTTSDLLIASLMHETAHAYQKFSLNFPMMEDGRDNEIKDEMAYAAVIESDAWAKGLTAFIKSEPTDKEIQAFQSTKNDFLKQIGFSNIMSKEGLSEKELMDDIFKKTYHLLMPEQANIKTFQLFLNAVLNDKPYVPPAVLNSIKKQNA